MPVRRLPRLHGNHMEDDTNYFRNKHNIPNFDAMTSEELMDFWKKYSRPTRKDAAALVGKQKGYITLCGQLAAYACNKAVAMRCRVRGDIQAAEIYEKHCELDYERLPDWAKWDGTT